MVQALLAHSTRFLRRVAIRHRLIASLILLSLPPLLLSGYISFVESSQAIENKARVFATEIVKQVARNVQLRLTNIEVAAATLVLSHRVQSELTRYADDAPTEQAEARAMMPTILLDTYGSFEHVKQMFFLDKEHHIMDSQVFSTLGRSVEQFSRQAPRQTGGPYWGTIDQWGGEKGIVILQDIYFKANNQWAGSLFLGINRTHFSEIFDDVNLGPGSDIYILDAQDGSIIVASKSRLTLVASANRAANPELVQEVRRSLQSGQPTGFLTYVNTDPVSASQVGQVAGRQVVTVFSRVANTSWFVVNTIPQANLQAEARAVREKIFLVGALGIVFAALLSFILWRSISDPLQRLLARIQQTESGNFPIPLVYEGHDELTTLSQTFSAMSLKISEEHARLEQRVQERTLQLAARESLLRQIMDTAPIAVFLVDMSGRITHANHSMVEMFGYPMQDLLGKEYVALVDSVELEISREKMLTLMNGEIPIVALDRKFVRANGKEFWAHLTGKLFLDPSGNKLGLVGVIADITERKEAEAEIRTLNASLEERVRQRTADLEATNQALIQAKLQADAANLAKSIFLANMSHELRTPMNGVMGMIDLVLRRATDPQQIDWLKKSRGSAQHLLEVINDILDISKMESGRLVLDEKNFSLAQTVGEAIQMLDAQAQAKSLTLSRNIAPTLPDLLCGDATRLRQILLNFIGNAIKFSERGQITVNLSDVEEDSNTLMMRIEVTDQGIGISPEQQSRLFNPFTQADGSMNRKYGGTGLGLVISKRIALLMGGDAGVVSEEDKGSTFWATVRLNKATKELQLPPAPTVDAQTILRQSYYGHFILVVDDEPINLEIVRMQLEALDLAVDTAADGAQAIARAKQNDYAAILMDMQMPNVNGLEATRQIRQIHGHWHTPIIAMTANVFAEDKARCMQAGMSDFLAKPFKPDELFETLLRALQDRDA